MEKLESTEHIPSQIHPTLYMYMYVDNIAQNKLMHVLHVSAHKYTFLFQMSIYGEDNVV